MVGALHGDKFGVEAVGFGQGVQLAGVVVGHEEVAAEGAGDTEEFGVVDLGVEIEAAAGALGGGGVGWINEEDGGGVGGVLARPMGTRFQAVALDEIVSGGRRVSFSKNDSCCTLLLVYLQTLVITKYLSERRCIARQIRRRCALFLLFDTLLCFQNNRGELVLQQLAKWFFRSRLRVGDAQQCLGELGVDRFWRKRMGQVMVRSWP